MQILFLTQIVPYPPDAGPRVKTWHVLRYLAAQGHQVTLVSFTRPEEMPFINHLKQVCAEVVPVPIHRSRVTDVGYWLRSHLSGRPFLIERDDKATLRAEVKRLVSASRVDIIHADQLGMAQFALPYGRASGSKNPAVKGSPRLVFDAHNAVWTIVERMRQTAPFYLRPPAALEASRVKRYEGWIIQQFDHTLAVTDPDKQALLQAVSYAGGEPTQMRSRIRVVPIAVDTQALQPARRQPGSFNIVTLGTLHYPPNADGIRWFMNEVFPRIRQAVPGATLTVIGRNPPADFLQAAAQDPQAIRVTGYVPDLGPFMDAAALMVVAVRAGGGMRVRILEAFARAMPVVTTTVGLEGIQAEPGEEVLVADTPETFAEETIRLLKDPALQARLAANGRCLAEKRYDWQAVLKEMDAIYGASKEPETARYDAKSN